MPLHIKELFLEVIQHYYTNIEYYFNQYLPSIQKIIQFNRISKTHYEWVNSVNGLHNSIIFKIKHIILWFNAQL